ncbi:PREDICTED: LOW QUALITY PROTEIN: dehydrogenase/reductase SDR family member 2, mitochondrial-like [Odobenus rosmarus divergens]|uniref:LOW QUALITY PROTEIN: dehydrogenase/reductase SDR family member 2, mitochondrial-like n=1 Tax=Odobenus rosmarus divergens TaxID=9708 RepID=A0A2U3W2M4_ODORO|nr:PREDICTED: LOW QUALITY PROTEIN: dehydrogenase/reductase SDR family member 2, mitochondrial-like [Odobenus rosmarus divergens]
MFQAVTSVHRHQFHSCARLSLHLSSTGIDQKGVLANRVAVVTGSTEGIGYAMARRLAQDGAHVVISSRKQQNVDRAVAVLQGEGLSVAGTVCHVGKAEDRKRLVATVLEHYGGLDFLVCNAGVNPLVGSTLKASEEVWDKILDVNVKSPALLLSQLLPHMEKRGTGAVVLVSSIAAYIPHVKLGPYNISKTAMLGLTRTLSLELAPKGIRVNCLVPGIIETNFSKLLHKDEVFWNECKKKYQLKRIGQPEDCAGIVSFLFSPDASYITGENIVVAGFSSRL